MRRAHRGAWGALALTGTVGLVVAAIALGDASADRPEEKLAEPPHANPALRGRPLDAQWRLNDNVVLDVPGPEAPEVSAVDAVQAHLNLRIPVPMDDQGRAKDPDRVLFGLYSDAGEGALGPNGKVVPSHRRRPVWAVVYEGAACMEMGPRAPQGRSATTA